MSKFDERVREFDIPVFMREKTADNQAEPFLESAMAAPPQRGFAKSEIRKQKKEYQRRLYEAKEQQAHSQQSITAIQARLKELEQEMHGLYAQLEQEQSLQNQAVYLEEQLRRELFSLDEELRQVALTNGAPHLGAAQGYQGDPLVAPLPADFQPSQGVLEELTLVQGIPVEFIEEQLREFKFYWHETGEKRKGWQSRFRNKVISQWKREQSRVSHEKGRRSHQSTIEKLTDTSWADKYNFDIDE